MTKEDLVTEISKKTGIEKFIVLKTVEGFMATVRGSMEKGQNIYMRGFGTFLLKKRARKAARNISKNTMVIIPAHYVPVFKPSREFVASIKNKKA